MEDQQKESETIKVTPEDMHGEFLRILIKNGFTEEKAIRCAEVFTENSIDGVYTHGVNRFPRFIQYIKDKFVMIDAEPVCVSRFGGLEQWDGNLGAGPLNAILATDRVVELAKVHGIGCVALANTNHWMRGGLYGWKAAKKGCIFISWTNTIANMPAWGAIDAKLGNNPLVFALPHNDEAIVLDMAMSQYSYGALELYTTKKQLLPVQGGYDKNGKLTNDPDAILASQRVLPIGYWKGAGLSLLLDILAAILSGGNATGEITRRGPESAVSQVFIAIDPFCLFNYKSIASAIQQIIDDYHQSIPQNAGEKILYPGERVLETRKRNREQGIPVSKSIWEGIINL
jgi:3-dehydro-L-gulonate 2-dehydrogenase